MRIFVTGTRGIPDIPGGVERHCEELYPRLAAMGHEVVVCTRSCYVTQDVTDWRGVRLAKLPAPRINALEAIMHTARSVFHARKHSPDLVHVHAIGPGLMVPLAKLMGFRVVVTNHGPDYDRAKWGGFAKTALKLGEWLGGKYADEVIVISSGIGDTVRRRCKREGRLIYNGVPPAERSAGTEYLEQIGVEPGNFILAVARLVPEKGLHDLIEAFVQLKPDCKLVIAGGADHETAYSRELVAGAGNLDAVVLTGYITGEPLRQVYSHARVFCLPSYHEGLPIALLEALSYGLPVVASDIPANREVELPAGWYFRCGDVDDLRTRLEEMLGSRETAAECVAMTERVRTVYDWDEIARQVETVYDLVVTRTPGNHRARGT